MVELRRRWERRFTARAALILIAALVALPAPLVAGTAAGPPRTILGNQSEVTSTETGVSVPAASGPINTTLTVGGLTGYLSPYFWGTTVNNEVHLLRGESELVNATPVRVTVWPGAMAGEDYDPLTNTHYDTYSGAPKTALTSEVQFVQLCEAIHCTSIVQLPAEIDDPAYAEKIVNYTEVNLSFHPSYWMIGNEPELWGHWKSPWKDWATTYTGGPDPTQFGDEVVAYVKAIRNVDNTTPILGLPASGCTCGYWTFAQWISGVLAVTGNKIQAVAFHEYPAGWLGTGDGSLADFYYTIRSAAGITTRMVAARQAVTSSCSGCNVSVFISELGAALSWSAYGQYAAGFSGSLSIAAQLTQAMDDNLTNVDLFATELDTTNSWFNNSGHARPDYGLYTQILGHLGGEIYPVNVTGAGSSVFAIATNDSHDAGRRDLLVVNTNVTHAVSFAPEFPSYSGNAPVQAWYWNGSIHTTAANYTTWVEPYTPLPVIQQDPTGLPTTYTLPAQSLVLFETYPGGGTYVKVTSSGVPNGTSWATSIGPRFYTTTGANISLLLAPGAYPIAPAGIPLPIGGREFTPVERLGGFVPSPLVANGSFTNASVEFTPQWKVNISSTPNATGAAWPDVGWWNQSQPLKLNVTPTFGNAFVRWDGWGNGSVSGPNRSITVTPTGPIHEVAHFVAGIPALFQEVGLPNGWNWTVSVRGFSTSSNSTFLDVYEPVGSFGFHVSPVKGYRVIPENGSFSTLGPASIIRFDLITPPPPTYAVRFQATGLPSWDPVTITVRTSSVTLPGGGVPFQLINGTYAYDVGYVPGYHAVAPLKLFNVTGGPLVVTVPFVPTVYSVFWQGKGIWSSVNWSLDLSGVEMNATSSWIGTHVTNGSYFYWVNVPSNFSVSPRSGVVVVNGTTAAIPLNFSLLAYSTGFEAGVASVGGWSVRLGNAYVDSAGGQAAFTMANGTYTFDVHPPAGYYAVPSHGNLTVAGPTLFVKVQFLPISLQPSAALVAQLTLGALVVSAWVGLSGAVVFAVGRALRRGRRGA